MENKPLNGTLLREMYNTVRSEEIKNIKTQKYDNRQMVSRIEKYIFDKVQKEVVEK